MRTNGNGGICQNCPQKSFWPDWHGNKPFALVLLLVGAFLVVFLMAKVDQIQKETERIGQPEPFEHQISVEGQGKVTGKPDIANLSLTVETKGDEVAAAQSENTTTMNALIAKIKDLGISADDIQTSSYNVYENTVWNPETEEEESKGWVVSQTLTVKVRDTGKIAAVLQVAGEGGATNIYGPSFTIDDTSALKDLAREKAIEEAQAKAVILAARLGVRLEKVVGYGEWQEYEPGPYYGDFGGAAEKPTIEPGSQEVILNVSITYKLAE